MNIYFVSEFNDKGNNAGSKARNDLEKIFTEHKWRKINNKAIVATINHRNIAYFVKSFIGALRLHYEISLIRDSIIFCQYPALKGSIIYGALKKASKTNKICFIVHDINALRVSEDKKKNLLNKDISILNQANVVVVHNEFMREVLENNGLTVKKVVELNLFDYLASNKKKSVRKMSKTVVFAGNLKKSDFIYALCNYESINFKLNLYGSNFQGEENDIINYMGSFPPDEVVDNLEGGFGLVWDGSSVDTCNGLTGVYTRYNNPHKLSLYIGAGLPVIVWSQAAIAKFVSENKIGFAVDSLLEIPEKLNSIKQTTYTEYIENISALRKRVREGYYTNEVIVKVLSFLGYE